MRVVSSVALLGWTCLAVGHGTAWAQAAPDDPAKLDAARPHVDAALAAQDRGDYDTAIALYWKAYDLVSQPVLLFRLAHVHRLAGQPERALALYQSYLAADPQGPMAQTARELVVELDARPPEPTRPAEDRRPEVRPSASADLHKADSKRKRDARRHGISVERRVGHDDGNPSRGKHLAYRRSEQSVDARDDAGGALDAPLVERPSDPPVRSTTIWKWSLGVSAAVTAGSLAFSYYSWRSELDAIGQVRGAYVTSNDCDRALPLTAAAASSFQHACDWHHRATVGFVIAGVGLAGAVASSVLWAISARGSDAAAGEVRSNAARAMVAPILSPGGAGAALSLTW